MQLTLSGRVRLMHAALEWIPGNAPFKHLFSHLLMQNMRWMVSSGISIPLLRYLLICWPKAVLRSGKRQNSASTCTRSAIALACRLADSTASCWGCLGIARTTCCSTWSHANTSRTAGSHCCSSGAPPASGTVWSCHICQCPQKR